VTFALPQLLTSAGSSSRALTFSGSLRDTQPEGNKAVSSAVLTELTVGGHWRELAACKSQAMRAGSRRSSFGGISLRPASMRSGTI
jgi:hypothetical protein